MTTPSGHSANCDWHLDQYPWECTCGAGQPGGPRGRERHGKHECLRSYRQLMGRRAFRRLRGYMKGIQAWI